MVLVFGLVLDWILVPNPLLYKACDSVFSSLDVRYIPLTETWAIICWSIDIVGRVIVRFVIHLFAWWRIIECDCYLSHEQDSRLFIAQQGMANYIIFVRKMFITFGVKKYVALISLFKHTGHFV
jgi:hypothetical protein